MIAYLVLFFCQFSLANGDPLPVENYLDLNRDTIAYQIYTTFEEFEKRELIGKGDEVILVNFWATWCAPCVKELPYFEAYNQESSDVRILLVSLDFVEDIETRFKPFVSKKNLKSNLVILDDMDANKWIDMVDPSWSGTIPATLAIKGNKRLFTDKEFQSVAEIEDFIAQLKE